MNNSEPTPWLNLQKSREFMMHQTQRGSCKTEAQIVLNKGILINCLLLLSVSLMALFINSYYLHYVGNNYFPDHSILFGLILVLTLAGIHLQFSSKHVSFFIVREILFFYLIMSAIALITNAAQYTPFKPIDNLILSLESSAKIDMAQLVAWTAHKPLLKKLLTMAYASLEYQMAFLPLLIIFTLNTNKIRTYYFLLITSALIGFSIYYFFPTTAPASNLYSLFFTDEQRATGIKFHEIHNHLAPTTLAGGLIAFPSFHVIWAWFCLYLTYGYRWLFSLLLPLNGMILASCVLLGWHYPLDVLGAALVILMTHYLLGRFNKL